MPTSSNAPTRPTPTTTQVRRWRQYLANERAQAAVYRDLVTSFDLLARLVHFHDSAQPESSA